MSARARRALAVAVVLAVASFLAVRFSPWPSALLIRILFDHGAARAAKALEKHAPSDIVAHVDEHYDPNDEDAYLDVFRSRVPSSTTIVWIHGGAWISGSKDQIAGYLKVLAARGFATVGVGYSLAPEATYPTPLRQISGALRYLRTHGERLGVNPSRIVLAGDSAGAQLAAQLAAMVTMPELARRVGVEAALEPAELLGVLLYCGPYDATALNLEGPFGWFLRTVLWSYTGERDFARHPGVEQISVIKNVGPAFPPAFISAGNGDPLEPQSQAFAAALRRAGVRVDALFFPENHVPALPHEYQLNLDTPEGGLALERSLAFLGTLADQP